MGRETALSPRNRIALARKLWGWEPHPTQREWLLDDHQVKVAACGRRWGKTESAAVDVATYAIASAQADGSVQMIVAPTYDQSKLIFGTVEQLLLGRDDIRGYVQITKTPYPFIMYRNSRIMARTADEDGRNLRGHSADRVVVDEAAFVRDEVIEEVIGPMLADSDGRLVMISTPFGKNHFYRAFVQGESSQSRITNDASRVRSFRFPSWENPHISREYIEYQRSVLTDRQFRVEYEAEFIDDTNSVFPWADIEGAVGDAGHRVSSIEHPASSIRIAGVDWARYSDYTAVVILEVSDSPILPLAHSPTRNGEEAASRAAASYRMLMLDRFNRMDWHSQVARVADLLERHRVIAVAADQTSVGDPVLELLRNELWGAREMDIAVEGLVFTNQVKRELMDNLAIRLAHREVVIPRDERLIGELQYYEYELTESGHVRTGARSGYHDDCVTALALALNLARRYGFTGGAASSGHIRTSAGGW